MTSKHTPGPWKCERYFVRPGVKAWVISQKAFKGSTRLKIAEVYDNGRANARLIADAPTTAAERDCLRKANIAMARVAEGEHLRATALHRENAAKQDRLKAINAELLTTLNLVITEISQDAHEHELIICNIERLTCAAIAKAKEPTA